MFIIDKNTVISITSNDLEKTLKEIDDCIETFIIIPAIYHIKTNSGDKINGFCYYLFNKDENIFLKFGYKLFGNTDPENYYSIISTLKKLDLKKCLTWFYINHRNTLQDDYFKIFNILSKKSKNIITKYNLQNKNLDYIIKYITKKNTQLEIELYDLLYDLIVSSDVIPTKYIKKINKF